MKKFFFIIILFAFFLNSKTLAYSNDPKQFIQEIVDEAKKVLIETNSKEYKTKKLSEMALKTVDIKGVAYYTIGKYKMQIEVSSQKKTANSLFLIHILFLVISLRMENLTIIEETF